MRKPNLNEYASYYHGYVSLGGEDPLTSIKNQLKDLETLIIEMEADKIDYRYQEGKWSVKEVLIHLADSERVFAYRAMCIAREEQTAMPGFDQDEYMDGLDSNSIDYRLVKEELISLRKANIALFSSFNEEALNRKGIASDNEVSVRALISIIAGHFQHHMNILRERYF